MDGLLSLGWRRELLVESVHCSVSLEKSVNADSRNREHKKKRKAPMTNPDDGTPEAEARHVVDVTL